MIGQLFKHILKRVRNVPGIMAAAESAEKRVNSKTDISPPVDVKKPKLEIENSEGEKVIPKTKPPKRKKIALLTVYSGKGYHGVQIQTQQECPTIEGVLVKALYENKLIEEEHMNDMGKMWFQRASRTDKGVSAAGQVFSLLMRMDIDNAVAKINSSLPTNIRVLAVKLTTKGFDAKNNCAYRTYEYLTPTFAFAPVEELTTEAFRISDDSVAKINEVMQNFKGTHNFHNFTSRRKHHDRSANRYMMSFEAKNPFVMDGIEYLVITVRGQSFMLHQIRKMIGLTMAIVKGYASLDTIQLCWGSSKVDIPKAPGLGLLLDKLHYDGYNKRFGNDGIHEPIDWAQYKEEIEKFKMDHIYSDIMRTEKDERGMLEWLKTLHLHTYQMYVNPPKLAALDQSDEERGVDQTTPNTISKQTTSTVVGSGQRDNSSATFIADKAKTDETTNVDEMSETDSAIKADGVVQADCDANSADQIVNTNAEKPDIANSNEDGGTSMEHVIASQAKL